MTTAAPERFQLPGGLEIARVVTGLWQVADMERGGQALDPDTAAEHLAAYAESGFDTFDMADHYGTSELIAGRCHERWPDAGTFFTKMYGPFTAPHACSSFAS